MPNVIAIRSMAKEPISALLPRTKVKPSLIARGIGRCSVSVGAGGSLGSAAVTPSMITKPTVCAA